MDKLCNTNLNRHTAMMMKKEIEMLISRYRTDIAALEDREDDLMRQIEIFENLKLTLTVWYVWKGFSTEEMASSKSDALKKEMGEANEKLLHFEGVLTELQQAVEFIRDEEMEMRKRIEELKILRDRLEIDPDKPSGTNLPMDQLCGKVKEKNEEKRLINEEDKSEQTDWKKVCDDLLLQVNELNENLKDSSKKLKESETYAKHLEKEYSKLEKELNEKIKQLEAESDTLIKQMVSKEQDQYTKEEVESQEVLSSMKEALEEVRSAKKSLSTFTTPTQVDRSDSMAKEEQTDQDALLTSNKLQGSKMELASQRLSPVLQTASKSNDMEFPREKSIVHQAISKSSTDKKPSSKSQISGSLKSKQTSQVSEKADMASLKSKDTIKTSAVSNLDEVKITDGPDTKHTSVVSSLKSHSSKEAIPEKAHSTLVAPKTVVSSDPTHTSAVLSKKKSGDTEEEKMSRRLSPVLQTASKSNDVEFPSEKSIAHQAISKSSTDKMPSLKSQISDSLKSKQTSQVSEKADMASLKSKDTTKTSAVSNLDEVKITDGPDTKHTSVVSSLKSHSSKEAIPEKAHSTLVAPKTVVSSDPTHTSAVLSKKKSGDTHKELESGLLSPVIKTSTSNSMELPTEKSVSHQAISKSSTDKKHPSKSQISDSPTSKQTYLSQVSEKAEAASLEPKNLKTIITDSNEDTSQVSPDATKISSHKLSRTETHNIHEDFDSKLPHPALKITDTSNDMASPADKPISQKSVLGDSKDKIHSTKTIASPKTALISDPATSKQTKSVVVPFGSKDATDNITIQDRRQLIILKISVGPNSTHITTDIIAVTEPQESQEKVESEHLGPALKIENYGDSIASPSEKSISTKAACKSPSGKIHSSKIQLEPETALISDTLSRQTHLSQNAEKAEVKTLESKDANEVVSEHINGILVTPIISVGPDPTHIAPDELAPPGESSAQSKTILEPSINNLLEPTELEKIESGKQAVPQLTTGELSTDTEGIASTFISPIVKSTDLKIKTAKEKEINTLIARYNADIAALEERKEHLMAQIELSEYIIPSVSLGYMLKLFQNLEMPYRGGTSFPNQEEVVKTREKLEHLISFLEGLQQAVELIRNEEKMLWKRIEELGGKGKRETDKNETKLVDSQILELKEELQVKDTDWKEMSENLQGKINELTKKLNTSAQELRESEDYAKYLEEEYSMLEKQLKTKIELLENRQGKVIADVLDQKEKNLQLENQELLLDMQEALAEVRSIRETLSKYTTQSKDDRTEHQEDKVTDAKDFTSVHKDIPLEPSMSSPDEVITSGTEEDTFKMSPSKPQIFEPEVASALTSEMKTESLKPEIDLHVSEEKEIPVSDSLKSLQPKTSEKTSLSEIKVIKEASFGPDEVSKEEVSASDHIIADSVKAESESLPRSTVSQERLPVLVEDHEGKPEISDDTLKVGVRRPSTVLKEQDPESSEIKSPVTGGEPEISTHSVDGSISTSKSKIALESTVSQVEPVVRVEEQEGEGEMSDVLKNADANLSSAEDTVLHEHIEESLETDKGAQETSTKDIDSPIGTTLSKTTLQIVSQVELLEKVEDQEEGKENIPAELLKLDENLSSAEETVPYKDIPELSETDKEKPKESTEVIDSSIGATKSKTTLESTEPLGKDEDQEGKENISDELPKKEEAVSKELIPESSKTDKEKKKASTESIDGLIGTTKSKTTLESTEPLGKDEDQEGKEKISDDLPKNEETVSKEHIPESSETDKEKQKASTEVIDGSIGTNKSKTTLKSSVSQVEPSGKIEDPEEKEKITGELTKLEASSLSTEKIESKEQTPKLSEIRTSPEGTDTSIGKTKGGIASEPTESPVRKLVEDEERKENMLKDVLDTDTNRLPAEETALKKQVHESSESRLPLTDKAQKKSSDGIDTSMGTTKGDTATVPTVDIDGPLEMVKGKEKEEISTELPDTDLDRIPVQKSVSKEKVPMLIESRIPPADKQQKISPAGIDKDAIKLPFEKTVSKEQVLDSSENRIPPTDREQEKTPKDIDDFVDTTKLKTTPDPTVSHVEPLRKVDGEEEKKKMSDELPDTDAKVLPFKQTLSKEQIPKTPESRIFPSDRAQEKSPKVTDDSIGTTKVEAAPKLKIPQEEPLKITKDEEGKEKLPCVLPNVYTLQDEKSVLKEHVPKAHEYRKSVPESDKEQRISPKAIDTSIGTARGEMAPESTVAVEEPLKIVKAGEGKEKISDKLFDTDKEKIPAEATVLKEQVPKLAESKLLKTDGEPKISTKLIDDFMSTPKGEKAPESKPLKTVPLKTSDDKTDKVQATLAEPLESAKKDTIPTGAISNINREKAPSLPAGRKVAPNKEAQALQHKLLIKDHLIKSMADQLREMAQKNEWAGSGEFEEATSTDPVNTYDFGPDTLLLYLRGKEPQSYASAMKSNEEYSSSNPLNVKILKKLDKSSLMIEWGPPPSAQIVGFQIFVNGHFMYWVHSAKRNMALLQPLDLKLLLEITVSPIDGKGQILYNSSTTYKPQ